MKIRITHLLLILYTILPSVYGCGLSTQQIENDKCVASFDSFAFSPPEELDEEIEGIHPLPTWREITEIPKIPDDNKRIRTKIDIARSVHGKREIWIRRYILPIAFQPGADVHEYLVFTPESEEWKIISAEVGDTGIWIDQLFVTSDGEIWGRNTWKSDYEYPFNYIPVLSKYNEKTERFEFEQNSIRYKFAQNINQFFDWQIVLLGGNDVFWIFIQEDGLYTFDSKSLKVEFQVEIPDFVVYSAIISPDGTIYFRKYPYEYSIQQGELYSFSPNTKEMKTLEIPLETWPQYSNFFVDQEGILWLDTIGYREQNGNWQLLYPDVDLYLENISQVEGYRWITPHVVMQSSNGILWFTKYTLSDNGTAWYDPKTGEGCMFTNYYSEIVEDSKHNIWLIADSKLYNYALYP